MGGLYGILGIASGALGADEGAATITSNNIANVNTPGYSREQINLSENAPIQVGNFLVGDGVSLDRTTSIRDNLLQQRINQENQTAGQLTAFLGPLNQVQSIFNETSGSGLQTPLTAFFNSLTQLSDNPSSSSLREGVITAGQNLASAFQQDSSTLQSLQSNADLSVQQSVNQINTLTTQIAALNNQVSSLTAAGQDGGAIEDQRSLLVNQLSGLVDVSQTDAGNGNITLTTSNGAALVVGGQSFALTTQINPTTTFHDVYSQGTDITSSITSGSLGGEIQVRDQEIPTILNKLNTLAYGLATAVNTQSAAGFDANGNPGANFFSAPATVNGAASSIAVAITDPNLVAASSDGSVGSNGNVQALANLQNQNIVDGQTPANYYGGLIYEIGNDVSQANTEQTSVGLVQQQLTDQQGAISGVSLDEEATNLIRYQSAYQAAANVVTIVNDLLYTVVNMDVITT
ncbi:MAG: flagellar hook-associated protein FlgK [Candidatus Acidiferrales bacterium]|jgi:flagellar hook-associated protein 1 FlgK